MCVPIGQVLLYYIGDIWKQKIMYWPSGQMDFKFFSFFPDKWAPAN